MIRAVLACFFWLWFLPDGASQNGSNVADSEMLSKAQMYITWLLATTRGRYSPGMVPKLNSKIETVRAMHLQNPSAPDTIEINPGYFDLLLHRNLGAEKNYAALTALGQAVAAAYLGHTLDRQEQLSEETKYKRQLKEDEWTIRAVSSLGATEFDFRRLLSEFFTKQSYGAISLATRRESAVKFWNSLFEKKDSARQAAFNTVEEDFSSYRQVKSLQFDANNGRLTQYFKDGSKTIIYLNQLDASTANTIHKYEVDHYGYFQIRFTAFPGSVGSASYHSGKEEKQPFAEFFFYDGLQDEVLGKIQDLIKACQ